MERVNSRGTGGGKPAEEKELRTAAHGDWVRLAMRWLCGLGPMGAHSRFEGERERLRGVVTVAGAAEIFGFDSEERELIEFERELIEFLCELEKRESRGR
jgi:hypothetical protein